MSNNSIEAARVLIHDPGTDSDLAKQLSKVVDALDAIDASAAIVDAQRNDLKQQVLELGIAREAATAKLLEILPVNPLGNLTIGPGA